MTRSASDMARGSDCVGSKAPGAPPAPRVAAPVRRSARAAAAALFLAAIMPSLDAPIGRVHDPQNLLQPGGNGARGAPRGPRHLRSVRLEQLVERPLPLGHAELLPRPGDGE